MRKKVLFLITKGNFGGAQRYVYDLATELPKDAWECAVAVGGGGPLGAKLQAAGVRVITIPSLERDISFSKELKALKEISKIVRIEQPDVFHINSSKAGALGALIGRWQKVPKIIFTAHGWAFNEDRSRPIRFILKSIHYFTVLLAHQTIAVSAEVRRQMNWPFARRKMTVIYNGRKINNLEERAQARERLAGLAAGQPLARLRADFWSLTIAELHPIKRHDAVIKAMKEVVRLWPHTRHLIIGGGQEAQRLRTLIAEYELEEHVFLLGNVPEAAQYLRAADLFILASRSEALPYAVIEAAMAELPIVAAAVGGIPEIIENETSGLLIPPLNDKVLLEAILRLRADPDLRRRLAAGAAKRAEEFRFDKTLRQTAALYRYSD